ncbi:pyridoxamine 5'-phosphate oxidase family protein [Jannaschia sp. 2305UL9-9]|uniref:pyridoxamine 5'-phosphate oxidase family protein n=1 Tax=Jannaschia sp. 2305UL9-9 TaxID=3121638 RepID=UPI003527EDCA
MDAYRPLDDDARDLARTLMSQAMAGALGTLRGRVPMVTRVGCVWIRGQGVVMLISDLSDHARALAAMPDCSILLGDVVARGDPLTQPRLTLLGRAEVCDKAALRDDYLTARPKARLYFDFTDFRLLRILPSEGLLNGGFGKAYRFSAEEIAAL